MSCGLWDCRVASVWLSCGHGRHVARPCLRPCEVWPKARVGCGPLHCSEGDDRPSGRPRRGRDPLPGRNGRHRPTPRPHPGRFADGVVPPLHESAPSFARDSQSSSNFLRNECESVSKPPPALSSGATLCGMRGQVGSGSGLVAAVSESPEWPRPRYLHLSGLLKADTWFAHAHRARESRRPGPAHLLAQGEPAPAGCGWHPFCVGGAVKSKTFAHAAEAEGTYRFCRVVGE